MKDYKFVIIGGGIAGVTCLETLCNSGDAKSILLISASPLVKVVTNVQSLTDNLQQFDVAEKPLGDVKESYGSSVLHDSVISLDTQRRTVVTKKSGTVIFEYLCICTGAHPKLINSQNKHILGIRDTESVKKFQNRLVGASRILIVGNGGIATELVYEIDSCDIVWAIKDDSIVSAFVDAGAGTFFLRQATKKSELTASQPTKRLKYTANDEGIPISSVIGTALGPDWLSNRSLQGTRNCSDRNLHVEYNVDIRDVRYSDSVAGLEKYIFDPFENSSRNANTVEQWPIYVELSNSKLIGCDLVVSATGVIPNSQIFASQLMLADDGGIAVNKEMMTSESHIYAAGDVATANWDIAPHWLQMRLWTQARQQGHYVAKCMLAADLHQQIQMDICFELFTHVTKFFNFKVILLGRFNGQGLGDDHTLLLRVTEGVEYIKAVLKDGKLQGAILIGETDLEETFENLILNQIDLSRYGDELLDPNIDIEDYFD